METENSRLHSPASRPHRPAITPHTAQPVSRRPLVDGFAPRRPTDTTVRPPAPQPHKPIPVITKPTPQVVSKPIPVAASRPVVPPQSHPAQPVQTHPVSNNFKPHPTTAAAPRSQTPDPPQREFVPGASDDLESSSSTKPKERNTTGHAGLVGFIVFVVLGALLASPFVPGKIMQNLPLSSSSFSTGDQVLDCLQNQGTVNSVTSYDAKAGSPLTYTYSTSTSQSATCNGIAQTAVVGHTSLFSPVALLIDTAAALVVAIVVAKVWRLIFGEKRSKR